MNSQLFPNIPSLDSLDGEELLSYLLVTFKGDFDDHSEQLILGQLIRAVVNSGTSSLPNAVLRQLENFEVTADQLLPIQRTMKIAGALLDANEETMRFFLTRKIVTSVVVLLDGLLGLRPETTSSQKERLQTCIACFMLVCVAMRCSNGVPWVVEAFESDLLSLLLKVTDELKSTRGFGALVRRLIGIISEVLGTVTECMSYYSVITALSTIKGKRNAARAVRAQESGPLKDKWVTLFNLIIERCAIQGLLSARIRNVPIPCDNVECNTNRRRGDMLKCAGCLCTFYCSQPCQRRAWKFGDHKAVCTSPDTSDGLVTWGSRDMAFLPLLCQAWVVKNSIFISTQARKKFPRMPAYDIAFSVDFRDQPPKVNVLHIEDVIRISPESSGMIRAASADKQFICLSSHSWSPGSPLPRHLCSPIQRVSSVECDVLYNLLEVLRQSTPDRRKHNECLDAAKQSCQSFETLVREVHEDFRSFLADSTRRTWSSSDAKDVVCRFFDTAGLNWLSIRTA